MDAFTVIDRKSDLKAIENGLRNKFRWDWLEEKDSNGDYLSKYVRKLNKPGVVVCVYCDCRLDYSKKGKSFIKRHAQSVAHTSKRNSIISTQALPAIFKATASLERGDSSTSVNSNPSN